MQGGLALRVTCPERELEYVDEVGRERVQRRYVNESIVVLRLHRHIDGVSGKDMQWRVMLVEFVEGWQPDVCAGTPEGFDDFASSPNLLGVCVFVILVLVGGGKSKVCTHGMVQWRPSLRIREVHNSYWRDAAPRREQQTSEKIRIADVYGRDELSNAARKATRRETRERRRCSTRWREVVGDQRVKDDIGGRMGIVWVELDLARQDLQGTRG